MKIAQVVRDAFRAGADPLTDVCLWTIARVNRWKDHRLASRLRELAELYDTRPRGS
jgi:hypothetical protein